MRGDIKSLRLSVRLFVHLSVAKTFETLHIGLSYFTCVFLMKRPFHSYRYYWHDLDRDPYLKNLTFVITFEPLESGLSCSTCTFLLWDIPVHTKIWHICDFDRDIRPTYLRTWNRKKSISQLGQSWLAQDHDDCTPSNKTPKAEDHNSANMNIDAAKDVSQNIAHKRNNSVFLVL